MLIIVMDTETTGTTAPFDAIELASLSLGNPITSYRQLMKPHCPIEPGASNIHGYFDHDVAHFPPAKESIKAWWEAIKLEANGREIVICGHNTIFDIKVVAQHIPEITQYKRICTLRMGRALLDKHIVGNHRLPTLYKYLGCTTARNAHTALDDCKMTYDILLKMLPIANQSLLELIEFQNNYQLLNKVRFGERNIGKLYSEVTHSDLRWMVDNLTDPDVIYTAKYYLNGGKA